MINLTRADDDALSRRFIAAHAVLAAARDDLFDLHLLEVARLAHGPFPYATELIISADTSDPHVVLDEIRGSSTVLWAREQPDTHQPDYRTGDGASLPQLIEAIETVLEDAIDLGGARAQWLPGEQAGTFRVLLAPLTMAPVPRVEVIVDHAPGESTTAHVFIDGELTCPEVTVVDPASGYTLSQWRATAEREAMDASAAAAELLQELFAEYETSQFIRDDGKST